MVSAFPCVRCGHRPCTCRTASMPLFDGPARKEHGRQQVEDNSRVIDELRELARQHARAYGTVTMDDVRARAERRLVVVHHPNVWGAIFRGEEWEHTGVYITSRRPTNNGRPIGVWKLKS